MLILHRKPYIQCLDATGTLKFTSTRLPMQEGGMTKLVTGLKTNRSRKLEPNHFLPVAIRGFPLTSDSYSKKESSMPKIINKHCTDESQYHKCCKQSLPVDCGGRWMSLQLQDCGFQPHGSNHSRPILQ